MLYYRYRPASELAIKELIYNEVYFGSAVENNDPYEGKQFYIFGNDVDKWTRLFERAWSDLNLPNVAVLAHELANAILPYTPLTFSCALDFNYKELLTNLPSKLPVIAVKILASCVKKLIEIYKPEEDYFACFSKNNDSHLMWAHYASMNTGFCLVFRAIDGKLYMDQRYSPRSISFNTEHGIAPKMSYGLPSDFLFEDILYNEEISSMDAFMCFPPVVAGYEPEGEEARIALCKARRLQYLEKDISWNYEEEARLLLTAPQSWLFGGRLEISKQKRLFRYNPNQLVGIILGPQMKKEFKQRILEIVYNYMERDDIIRKDVETPIFDFVVFEARLSDTSRQVIIEPTEILSSVKKLSKTDEEFHARYDAWQAGEAIVFDGKGGAHRKIFN